MHDILNVHCTDHNYLSQVDEAAIERYKGRKEPPHIEMMITAASDKTTPPDLIVEAMLQGVQQPNVIKFEQEAQNVVECVCQVFYRKKALNRWRAIFAFFPKQYLEVQIKTSIVLMGCVYYHIAYLNLRVQH